MTLKADIFTFIKTDENSAIQVKKKKMIIYHIRLFTPHHQEQPSSVWKNVNKKTKTFQFQEQARFCQQCYRKRQSELRVCAG